MLKIENTEVLGWEHAIRGRRVIVFAHITISVMSVPTIKNVIFIFPTKELDVHIETDFQEISIISVLMTTLL